MSTTRQFSVKPSDLLRYQATFTCQGGGKRSVNPNQSAERVVSLTGSLGQAHSRAARPVRCTPPRTAIIGRLNPELS